MKTRSTFRRRRGSPDNSAYHAQKEARRQSFAKARKPTAADMERIKESRRVQQAKADKRASVWTGARL